ncbi:MAG: phosphatase PAP2 family protein [Gemmatimonadota bacterium]
MIGEKLVTTRPHAVAGAFAAAGAGAVPGLAAMTATARLLAGYLALALLPLLSGGADAARIAVAAVHLLAIALLLYAAGDVLPRLRVGTARAGADHSPSRWPRFALPARPDFGRHPLLRWLPLLLVPFLYAELPLLNQTLTTGYHDALVLRWEASLFGGNPAQSWAGALPSVVVSELLHFSYLSYYALIYVPPLMLWRAGKGDAFDATVFTLLLVFVLCFAVFIVFPVQGPRYLFPAPAGVPEGPVRGVALAVLEAGSSRGAAFPSSHMAVAAAQAVLALRFQRRAGVVVALLAAGLGAGAVYGGFHYAVDIVAGGALGVLAALLHPAARSLIGGGAEGLAIAPSGA